MLQQSAFSNLSRGVLSDVVNGLDQVQTGEGRRAGGLGMADVEGGDECDAVPLRGREGVPLA